MSKDNVRTPCLNAEFVSGAIAQALQNSRLFGPIRVTVAEEEGLVRLSGTVHTERARQLAAATAWALHGVTDIENNIIVVEQSSRRPAGITGTDLT